LLPIIVVDFLKNCKYNYFIIGVRKVNEESKKLIILVLIVFCILAGIVLRTKVFSISTINKLSYLIECNKLPYQNGKSLCLGKDAGFKSDFETAEAYCAKLNLRLPSREEAWYIWLASENCHRAFAAGNYLPQNKYSFMNPEIDRVQAIGIKNYCNPEPSIKFSKSLQYVNGNFWLRDVANGKRHYTVNYNEGDINIYNDNTEALGVRCIGVK